jgi:hypothetical protein
VWGPARIKTQYLADEQAPCLGDCDWISVKVMGSRLQIDAAYAATLTEADSLELAKLLRSHRLPQALAGEELVKRQELLRQIDARIEAGTHVDEMVLDGV